MNRALLILGMTALCPAQEPQIDYRLRYVEAPAPGFWEIETKVTGLPQRARGTTFELEDWGQWCAVADTYLTELQAEPPLDAARTQGETFAPDTTAKWNGTLRLAYRIPLRQHGSPEHRAHGLLPWRLHDLASGFAHNTLPRVVDANAEPLRVARRVTFEAPANISIATGWGGVSIGKQAVTLEHDLDQCLVLFGPAPFVARGDDGTEVIQFGGERVRDNTAPILQTTQRLLAAYGATFGRPLATPERVFITGVDPHGGGGVRTDHGIGLGYAEDASSPHYRHTLAHELFHEWLPGVVSADGPTLVWFFEGFTEYLALWHAAQAGVVTPDWFADRMLEIDARARASTAFGKTSFTDPNVHWRDGDGPIETLAYNGGALLALHIDAALRQRQRGSTARMLADFAAATPPRYSRRTIERWLQAHGLGALYRRHLERGEALPETRAALHAVGFFRRPATRDGLLTYFGIESDAGLEPGRVLSIDADGPSAARDVRVGDRILDYGPRRTTEMQLATGVSHQHGFGLTLFDRSAGDWFVEVERDGKRLRIALEPWLSPGGREQVMVADPELVQRFLTLTKASRR